MKRRWKYTTARQFGGDDGYQWAIWIKGYSVSKVTGLTRSEVNYYRERLEREKEAKRVATNQDKEQSNGL